MDRIAHELGQEDLGFRHRIRVAGKDIAFKHDQVR